MNINPFVFKQLAFRDSFLIGTGIGGTNLGSLYSSASEFDSAILDAQAKLELQVDSFKHIAKIYGSNETAQGLPDPEKTAFVTSSFAAGAVATAIFNTEINAIGIFVTGISNLNGTFPDSYEAFIDQRTIYPPDISPANKLAFRNNIKTNINSEYGINAQTYGDVRQQAIDIDNQAHQWVTQTDGLNTIIANYNKARAVEQIITSAKTVGTAAQILKAAYDALKIGDFTYDTFVIVSKAALGIVSIPTTLVQLGSIAYTAIDDAFRYSDKTGTLIKQLQRDTGVRFLATDEIGYTAGVVGDVLLISAADQDKSFEFEISSDAVFPEFNTVQLVGSNKVDWA